MLIFSQDRSELDRLITLQDAVPQFFSTLNMMIRYYIRKHIFSQSVQKQVNSSLILVEIEISQKVIVFDPFLSTL